MFFRIDLSGLILFNDTCTILRTVHYTFT